MFFFNLKTKVLLVNVTSMRRQTISDICSMHLASLVIFNFEGEMTDCSLTVALCTGITLVFRLIKLNPQNVIKVNVYIFRSVLM